MSRKTLMVAVGAAALVLGMGAGAGAQYPTPTPNPNPCNQVADAVVAPGDEDSTSGQAGCFPGGVEIDGVFASHPVVVFTTTANADGSYTSPVFRIPRDAEPGDHSLTVTDGTTSYSRTIVVTGAAADAAGRAGRLPRTGGQIAFLALWATVLISFGSALIAFTWKRWRAARMEAVLLDESHDLPMLEPGSDIDDLRAAYGPVTDAETTGPVATIAGGSLDEPDEVTQTVQREAFSLASVTNGRTPQDVVADLEQQIANWRRKK